MSASFLAGVVFATLFASPSVDTGDAASVRRFDPARLSPAMAAWILARLPPAGERTAAAQRRALADLERWLLSAQGLGLEEAIGTTPTASKAFLGRRANCLGLAHLAAALGRRAGLDLVYVETRAAPVVERSDAVRVVHRHAAVALIDPASALVLDFGGVARRPLASLRLLTDHQARGLFYANRGAERLIAGEPAAALPWLEAAVELVEEAWLWRNLALAWMRTGRPAAAALAREHARALAGPAQSMR